MTAGARPVGRYQPSEVTISVLEGRRTSWSASEVTHDRHADTIGRATTGRGCVSAQRNVQLGSRHQRTRTVEVPPLTDVDVQTA